MSKKTMFIAMAVSMATAATLFAGTGLYMKCQAKPEKDPASGEMSKPCEYETMVTFGGGMLFDQITGYCRNCSKFVYLRWTSEHAPADLLQNMGTKVTPRPTPLGEVWDARTGQILPVYSCPGCKGPFVEIRSADELKHCPACNKPHFGIDESKPRMSID